MHNNNKINNSTGLPEKILNNKDTKALFVQVYIDFITIAVCKKKNQVLLPTSTTVLNSACINNIMIFREKF